MPGRRGVSELDHDLRAQLELMGERAPASRRVLSALLELIAEPSSALARRLERAWQHREFSAYYERPLLVLAALRHDALFDGEAHPLWAALRDEAPDPSTVTSEAVRAAMGPERLGLWVTLRTRRVQTNEVRRAVTWLWPASLAGAAGGQKTLALCDIGASAGLNLVADGVEIAWTDQDGRQLPLARDAQIVRRWGFDTRPLDVKRKDDLLWLRACIWPGESERLESLERALSAFQSAEPPAWIERQTASDLAPRLLELANELPERGLLIVYQTLLRGYLQPSERAAYEAAMLRLLELAPPLRVLWATLEVGDETDPSWPASLCVNVRTADALETLELARTSYHPATLRVDSRSIAAITEFFSR